MRLIKAGLAVGLMAMLLLPLAGCGGGGGSGGGGATPNSNWDQMAWDTDNWG